MNDPVTDAIVTAAENVPGHLLLLGAASVESHPGWSRDAGAALVAASPALIYRNHVSLIERAWAGNADLPGAAIALGTRAAIAAVHSSRAVDRVSLVWTGPPTSAVGLRSTRSVVKTLVANATESLVLVSFAGYKVDELVEGLSKAADRGVEVALILETRDDSGGDLSVDAAKAFSEVAHKAQFYRWPLEAREAFFASSARLHAKCIIADRSRAFITSANLTSAGLNDNIELGVLIEAGPLPANLHDHLDLLIEEGTLELVEGRP